MTVKPETHVSVQAPAEAVPTPEARPQARRFPWKLLIFLGVVGLVALVGVQVVRTYRGVKEGDLLPPDLTLYTFDGQTYRLGDLRGKVVLINFWASWCPPCAEEAPFLQEAWEISQARGDVLFLGVAWTDTDEKSLAYIERFGITYPNGPDIGTRWAQVFRIRGVPETYILDKEGRLAYIKIGPFANTQEILDAIEQVAGAD